MNSSVKFYSGSTPGWVIAEQDGKWFLVPPVLGGWAKRIPYHGHKVGLYPWNYPEFINVIA